jgi:hypothetical protein
MIDRAADPRTQDTIVYDLLRTPRGASEPAVVGQATFAAGRATVDAPDEVSIAVSELLGRAFVDRVEADERPRGYRRSGQGSVDMLVPGMPEHFIARLRGLWLPYPDGSVVTARPATSASEQPAARELAPDSSDSGAQVTDPAVRRATLAQSSEILHVGPLVKANDPEPGTRPASERMAAARTDCGWIV